MNPDEIDIDLPLVRRLITRQLPQWSDLPTAELGSPGSDDAMYRLGADMVVRLPRLPGAVMQVAKEQRWLSRLARLLPLAIPLPLARGFPDEGSPFPWSVYRWLKGENLAAQPHLDLPDAAVRLGQFVAALQRVDITGAPPSFRGGPVSLLDARVRREIRDLSANGLVEPDLATGAWETALSAPVREGQPVWVHADLYR